MATQDDIYSERDEQAEAKAKARRLLEMDDLKWLLRHPQGRRVITRILDQTGVYRSSFNHSGSQMAFNEGRRNTGLWLTDEMTTADQEGYLKLLREYQRNG